MANPQLSVEIGADTKALTTGLISAQKELSSFSNTASKNLAQLDRAALNGGQSLGNFKKGSDRAALALTDLGRVAQDAPFGFIGIQNNLNPLLDSFQRLKSETGSTGGALKALGGSLIGPAGLGIALSVVSAGILFYQQFQQKAKKSTDELSKSTENYKATLETVRGTLLTGAQDAQKEIASLDTLFRATQNTTLSLSERNKAVDELQSKYPQYFANLTNEQVLTDKGSEAYSRLKSSLIQVAQARAAENKIAELASRRLENEQKIIDERINNQKLLKDLTKANNLANATFASGSTGGVSTNVSDVQRASKLKEKIAESDAKIFALATDNNKATEKQLKLIEQIDKITANVGVDSLFDIKPNAEKDIKSKIERTLNAIKPEFTFDTLGLFNIQELVDKTKTPEVRLGIKVKPVLEFNNVISDAELQAIQSLQRFNDSANSIINGGIAETFSGLASVIGNGIANGGNVIGQLGSVLLGSFGNIAVQLGQLAIGTGIAVEGIKKALTSLSGPIAIAAGVALVALGSFVKGAAANIANGGGGSSDYKIPGFANGVTNFKGGLAVVGERGPELVNLPTGSNVITNQNIGRLSKQSNTSSVMIPDVKLRGQDLVIVFNRAEKFNGRR
jgi:hypothetical protein